MKTYKIHDIFYSLEGEGANVNKPMVFVQLAGCNLSCHFCDFEMKHNYDMTAAQIANKIDEMGTSFTTWDGKIVGEPFVLLTGAEAMLEVDKALIDYIRASCIPWKIGLETNGTIELGDIEVDYLIVRPKPGTELKIFSGNELKVVYPVGVEPKQFENLNFETFFVTPWLPPDISDWTVKDLRRRDIMECINYCLENPKWTFSITSHRIYGIK